MELVSVRKMKDRLHFITRSKISDGNGLFEVTIKGMIA